MAVHGWQGNGWQGADGVNLDNGKGWRWNHNAGKGQGWPNQNGDAGKGKGWPSQSGDVGKGKGCYSDDAGKGQGCYSDDAGKGKGCCSDDAGKGKGSIPGPLINPATGEVLTGEVALVLTPRHAKHKRCDHNGLSCWAATKKTNNGQCSQCNAQGMVSHTKKLCKFCFILTGTTAGWSGPQLAPEQQ